MARSGGGTAGAGGGRWRCGGLRHAGQNCHTFVPIVILQMDDEAWTRNSRDHRMRVSGLSDDEFNTAYAYLKKHFDQNHPVPKLPQVLLESWTTS
jgi:hypothetical protein